jgi:hypothetical protein
MELKTADSPVALEKELKTFARELPNLLANEGKYVVVAGDSIIGIFSAYEDALQAGYEKRGLEPFLVKKIQAFEQAQYFSRDLSSACPT